MADTKILEREYIIPLRRAWLKVPSYERSAKAIKAIKKFIAKHMKVLDRDASKVKLDVYFNNNLWFRGRAHPPSKVKVKAKKEGDIVQVSFVETPKYVEFLKAKHEKMFKEIEKPSSTKVPEVQEAKPVAPEKTEEEKLEEKEKEKAVAEQGIQQAEQQAKAQKHLTKVKEPRIQRMALKK